VRLQDLLDIREEFEDVSLSAALLAQLSAEGRRRAAAPRAVHVRNLLE
jgi:hypothetical protein